jgi:hypothetical protein
MNDIPLHVSNDTRFVDILAKFTGVQKQRTKKGMSHPFPGPNPVSIERADYPKFRSQPYHITEKTDGVRALMMIADVQDVHHVVIFDRTLTPYHFPIKEMPRALYQGTVFDGELVYDKLDSRWVYLCFDAINVAGVPIFHLPFSERLQIISTSLRFYKDTPSSDPGIIRPKLFMPFVREIEPAFVAHVDSMRQRYNVDGVIFQPELDRVIYGRHDNLMKLKTVHSVDFLVKNGKLNIFDETTRRNKVIGMPMGPRAHLATEGAIVECVLNDDQWHVLHVRDDKTTSNNKFTLDKTLLNIKERLTLRDVLQGAFDVSAHGNPIWN